MLLLFSMTNALRLVTSGGSFPTKTLMLYVASAYNPPGSVMRMVKEYMSFKCTNISFLRDT